MKEIRKHRVGKGDRVRWSRVDPDDTGRFDDEDETVAATDAHLRQIENAQRKLYAEGERSLLIVLQAMDTGGKDGTIRHLSQGLNPAGCQVTSFKVPTPLELSHDYLWRVHQRVPARGCIGIFNRSHYEDVLITRVHDLISHREAKQRFREITEFERLLVRNGTTIVKLFLAISMDEQRERLKARVEDPEKRWKFEAGDLKERKLWDRYQNAYADAISATNTSDAPWFIIPANRKWYRNYLVSAIVAHALKKMDPEYPKHPADVDFTNIRIPA